MILLFLLGFGRLAATCAGSFLSSSFPLTTSTSDCRVSEDSETVCQPQDRSYPRPDCDEPASFWICGSDGLLKRVICPSGTVYEAAKKGCAWPVAYEENRIGVLRTKRQTATGTIGQSCSFNIDCGGSGGLYCAGGLCACTSGYIQSQVDTDRCLRKINPNQAGCTENIQCSSVWDGARCNLGRCECPDPANEYVVQTRDGAVCVRDQADTGVSSCPLPPGLESDGATPQGRTSLVYPPDQTTPLACTNDPSTQAFSACQVAGQAGLADLYDCIPRRGGGGSHCCPNRAFTCLLPRDAGNGAGTFNRWWYNAVTDSCQTFVYTGRATGGPYPSGNSNNFGSQAHCESYCKDRCTRGQPAYVSSTYVPGTNAQTCSSVAACASSNFECQTVGTSSRCCNTPAFICGPNGGLNNVPATPAPGFDGDGDTNQAPVVRMRWYYSDVDRRCRQFQWNQYGGSFNNFATQDDCEGFCLNLCPYGEPLKVDSGTNAPNKACPCPSDYTCTNSVCCPSTELICNQAKNIGNACTGLSATYVSRYFYNSVTQRCESFTYGGCNGNLNNFIDESTCITACASIAQRPTCPRGRPLSFGTSATTGQVYTTCSATSGTQGSCPGNYECVNGGCCPTRSYTCSLTYNSGTVCGATSTRFYYDTTTGRCNSFQYLGCDGNSNNFGAQEECESYCGSGGCPNGGTPAKDVTTNVFLNCALSSSSCPNNYECSQVLVNSVTSRNVCCPSRTYVCSLGAYTGDSNCGTGGTTRYYFDSGSRACRAFIFNGCGANENNFISVEECNNYCGSAACPAGQAVLGGGGASAATCTVGVTESCPSGYTCVRDTLFNRNVCCGAGDQGVCSYGETAYIESSSLRPLRCQPGTFASCPTDYFCRLNTQVQNGEYVCCKPTVFCADGYLPALGFGTTVGGSSANKPVACYINGAGGFGNFGTGIATSCPNSFTCQNTVPGSPTGYCCSTNRVCPAGFTLYQTTGGLYQTCSPGGFDNCPANYRCVANSGSGATGYCCGQASSAEFCGASGRVLTDSVGTPRTCSPPDASGRTSSSCPAGYSCTASGSGLYYCCAGVAGVCGTGRPQLVGASQIQLCNRPGDSVCGGGFSCTLNANNGQYYCCSGGTSACPSPGIPQRLNGASVTCNPGISGGCDVGYSCVTSSAGASTGICCSGLGATVCGAGFKVYQPGGTPVTCDLADNRCGANRVCKLYAPSSTYYCCEPDSNVSFCPDGAKPALLRNQPRTCAPSVNDCPPAFACVLSTINNQYYCCSQPNAAATTCPQGGVLQAQTCSPQVPGSCPSGICQLINGNGVDRYQCCNDPNAVQTCSNGEMPTNSVCDPATGSAACSGGTVCLLVTGTGRYQCCPTGTLGQACPAGGIATNRRCNPNANSCGSGNSCQLVSGQNVCCSGSSGSTSRCPLGGTLQAEISCQGPSSSCGSGNSCQRITSLGPNQFRCCFGSDSSPTSNPPVGVCPQGGRLTAQPCSGGLDECRPAGTCQAVPGVGSRCCVGGGGIGGTCPGGGRLASPQRFCSPSPFDTCAQPGLSCQLVSGRYQCCTTALAVRVAKEETLIPATQQCSDGSEALINPLLGANTPCQEGNLLAGCPSGFRCLGGICCAAAAQEADCPSGRRAKYPFIGSNGLPTASNADLGCVVGGPACPPGYTCRNVPDVTSGGVCCRNLKSREPKYPGMPGISKNITSIVADIFGLANSLSGSHTIQKECTVLPCMPGQFGCSRSVECVEGRCEDHRCMCPPNKLISPYGKCTCNASSPCQAEESLCRDGQCHCQPPFVAQNGTLCALP